MNQPHTPPTTTMNDGDLIQTADGSYTLFSHAYQETFHSHYGAYAEAYHVFVQGANVETRLKAGLPTQILEIGFGLALNALSTFAAAQDTPLHYTALEHQLQPTPVLAAPAYGTLFDPALVNRFLQWRQSLGNVVTGQFSLELAPQQHLTLVLGDATQTLPTLQTPFDAIYHDAFSPDVNPELWTPEFLASLYHHTAERGALTSYCIKGVVRRALAAAGFDVHKRPGPPGGKRQVLFAQRPSNPTST